MTQPPNNNPGPLDPQHIDPDLLSAYIDGELSPAEQHAVEQHLATCHTCTLRVLNATQLKAATARAGHRFAPPPEALARLTAHLQSQTQLQPQPKTQSQPQAQTQVRPQPQSQPKSPTPFQPRTTKPLAQIRYLRPALWTALVAALLLVVSLLGWRQLHTTNTVAAERLSAELLDQHLATLSSAATPQVLSTDRHTVKPWFQGRIPFSFNLPNPDGLPADTTLKGADLTYLNNQPAALLLFTIRQHQVSVFLTQPATGPLVTALPSSRAGFNLRTATTPGLRITAVSDVNPADLDSLVASMVQAQ